MKYMQKRKEVPTISTVYFKWSELKDLHETTRAHRFLLPSLSRNCQVILDPVTQVNICYSIFQGDAPCDFATQGNGLPHSLPFLRITLCSTRRAFDLILIT